MNDSYGNSELNLSKSFATDINVATKTVFAGGRNMHPDWLLVWKPEDEE